MTARDEDASALKRWLREQREAAGLSQRDAGQRIGVTARTIRNWESEGSGFPRVPDLFRYLAEIGVTMHPPSPVAARPTLDDRLVSIERELADLRSVVEANTRTLRLLEQAFSRLDERLATLEPPP